MVKKVMLGLSTMAAVFSLAVGVASAHVTVKPAEVGVATRQIFNVSVPNEKDVAVTKIRLVIPVGVDSVTPNVKPGWNVEAVKTSDDGVAAIKEIVWDGGSIPAGQRDDFAFSAKAPAKTGEVQWKAYQTYEDGTTVSWDQAPKADGHSEEGGNAGPYSVTKVVDDLEEGQAAASTPGDNQQPSNGRANTAIALSVVALLFSLAAMTNAKARKRKPKASASKL